MLTLFNVGKKVSSGGSSNKTSEPKDPDERTRKACCLMKASDRSECPDGYKYYDSACENDLRLYCSRCYVDRRQKALAEAKEEQKQLEGETPKQRRARLRTQASAMRPGFGSNSAFMKSFDAVNKLAPLIVPNDSDQCESPSVFSQKVCRDYCKLNSTNSEWCKTIKDEYCRERYWDHPDCQAYCHENPETCNAWKQQDCNKAGEVSEQCTEFCHDNPNLCDVRFRETCPLSETEVCTLFCSHPDYSDYCKKLRSQHCNSSKDAMDTSFCQNFCSRNFSFCDGGMSTWCKEHPDDPKCTCLTSEIKDYNPLCVDSKCAATGYATTAMLESRGDGCEVVDCSQSLNISNVAAGGGVLVKPEYQQRCMLQDHDSTTNITDTDTTTTTTTSESTDIDSESTSTSETTTVTNEAEGPWKWLILAGGAIVVVIIVIIVIYFMTKKTAATAVTS